MLEPEVMPPPPAARKRVRLTLRWLILLVWVIGTIAVVVSMCVVKARRWAARQRLERAGQSVQMAFNEGRRAAITTRTDHYLVFARSPAREGGPDELQLRVFGRAGTGNPVAFGLPPGVTPELRAESRRHTPGVDQLEGCGLPVFPFQGFEGEFFTNGAPITGPGAPMGWVIFRPDGTIELTAPAEDQVVPPGYSLAQEAVERGVLTDLKLHDPSAPGEAVYIDIEPGTGRVRFEVLRVR